MTPANVASTQVIERSVRDRAYDLEALLLQIAVARPYNAQELARRISQPQKAIQEDLKTLMAQGAVHIHEGTLRASAAARIIAEAAPKALHEVHVQVLAELSSGAAFRPATLVGLAESGCAEESLLHLLIRAIGEQQGDAPLIAALTLVASELGLNNQEILLMRAADAAIMGRTANALALTDGLLTRGTGEVASRAALIAASAHLREHRLEQALALYRHVGEEGIGQEAAWAVVAAIGQGDLDTARLWRAAMGDTGLTSHAAGLVDMVDGLLCSVTGTGEGSLELLSSAVSTLTPIGTEMLLPETPAALAALVAIGRGDPATAESLLDRALKAELGGASGRLRHLLVSAWSRMAQGHLDAAEQRLESIAPTQLCARDRFQFWALRAGIARRRTDLSAMHEAWREARGHTFGVRFTLYDLLPLGEMMIVAARVRDTEREGEFRRSALALLDTLGSPVTWAAPLHWHGVQAAFQAEDPAALIPHANALVKASQSSAYAATLAQAGNTWLEVLRREADFASVETSVRALANHGHVWDASRLAGQAALQHPERESALSMMQLAREINKDQARAAHTHQRSSVLTARELEVARLVIEGQGYRAIGEQLFISPKTVEHHVARMRSRLVASSRAELLEKLHDIVTALES